MSGLLPLFKWTGGKRKEIPTISQHYPDFVKSKETFTYVEPFTGVGAVFWSLNNLNGHNVINDFDSELANFYTQVKKQNPEFLKMVKSSSSLYGKDKRDDENHKIQEANYYHWRNLDRNNALNTLSDAERAARFWIVNQLAFSGMRRFNGKGEFNVPYGHYVSLNSTALNDPEHTKLLRNTTITSGDYKGVVEENDKLNTFMFIDPPYTRVMKKYSADSEFGEDKQEELADTLKNLKRAKWMIVIDKSDLTMKLYRNHIKHTYALSYGVNIKNRFSTAVEHILATNY